MAISVAEAATSVKLREMVSIVRIVASIRMSSSFRIRIWEHLAPVHDSHRSIYLCPELVLLDRISVNDILRRKDVKWIVVHFLSGQGELYLSLSSSGEQYETKAARCTH